MKAALIGSCTVPLELVPGHAGSYPLVWLEDSFASRVERILRDYVVNLSAEFIGVHGEEDGQPVVCASASDCKAWPTSASAWVGSAIQRLSQILQPAPLRSRQRSGAVDLHRELDRRACSTSITTRCMPTSVQPRQSVSSLPGMPWKCANTSRPGAARASPVKAGPLRAPSPASQLPQVECHLLPVSCTCGSWLAGDEAGTGNLTARG